MLTSVAILEMFSIISSMAAVFFGFAVWMYMFLYFFNLANECPSQESLIEGTAVYSMTYILSETRRAINKLEPFRATNKLEALRAARAPAFPSALQVSLWLGGSAQLLPWVPQLAPPL